ncbi:MAG TPA: PEP-CTERM sorting domain-containing protein [Chthoniobacteraceae bacterium]|nr:PEP-CTERM sorting domain-containing protein [Chthoniobacteraceae bacterium]
MKVTAVFLRVLPVWLGIFAAGPLQAGYEIADVTGASDNNYQGYTNVYLDDGEQRITPSQWDALEMWEPGDGPPSGTLLPPGYIKNTPRNGEFNEEETFSSPGYPNGEVEMAMISGYSWKFIARIQSAMWPYNTDLFPEYGNAYEAAAFETTPLEGTIKFSSNEKNQRMTFWAHENNDPQAAKIQRYFVIDEWGNEYILGASGAKTDAEIPDSVASVVLPEGWSWEVRELDETLDLMPAYGAGNQAHYNLFRESADNSYFQTKWGESGHSIAEQIAGMPIWGGATDDNLLGRAGDDNLIHGAEGDDIIFSLGMNDLIYGDAGSDTVVFSGEFGDYVILDYADGGAQLTLSGFGYQKSLFDVEFLRFSDLTIATAAIPEPSSLALGLLGGVSALWLLRRRRRHGWPLDATNGAEA